MTEKKAIRVDDNDKKLKTYIQIVLDRSGSMDSIRKETVAHFNEQVQEIKDKNEDNMETLVSLTVFNGQVEFKFSEEPIESLEELAVADYQPQGSTALFDAMGLSMDNLEKLDDIKHEDTSVLFIVLTDGWENASHIYTQAQVAARIKALRETKRWTFVYIGANQDLEKVADQLNIPQTNMLHYCSDSLGTQSMSRQHTKSVGRYISARSRGVSAVSAFYEGDTGDKTDSES